MNCSIIEATVHVRTIGDWNLWPGGLLVILGALGLILGLHTLSMRKLGLR